MLGLTLSAQWHTRELPSTAASPAPSHIALSLTCPLSTTRSIQKCRCGWPFEDFFSQAMDGPSLQGLYGPNRTVATTQKTIALLSRPVVHAPSHDRYLLGSDTWPPILLSSRILGQAGSHSVADLTPFWAVPSTRIQALPAIFGHN